MASQESSQRREESLERHDQETTLGGNEARPSQRHREREKMKLLWEIEIPPIDLNEVADKIGDRERMELIKALVCASGERFDQRQLLAWLTEFVKNNEVEADL
jgi:hypothetical protein